MTRVRPTAHGEFARRVLVTGVGAVTPFALTAEESVRRLLARESALRETLGLDGRPRRAGVIEGFQPRPHFRVPKALKVSDRKTQLGVAAAAMALADAGFPDDAELRRDLAVLFACAATDLEIDRLAAAVGPDPGRRAVDDIPYFAERVLRRLYPLWLLVNLPNMLAAQVGIQLAATGPNHTLLTEWISSAQAIGEAFLAIRAGEVDAAVAGGAEAPISPVYAGCLGRQGLMDLDRGDLALAEAAAAMVLEAEETRGGQPATHALAEITGYATAAPRAADDPRDVSSDAAIIRASREALSMHRATSRSSASEPLRPADHWRVVGFGPPGVDIAALGRSILRDGHCLDAREQPRHLPVQELMGHPLGAAGALGPVLEIAGAAESSSAGDDTRSAFDLLCLNVGYTGAACALTFRSNASPSGDAREVSA